MNRTSESPRAQLEPRQYSRRAETSTHPKQGRYACPKRKHPHAERNIFMTRPPCNAHRSSARVALASFLIAIAPSGVLAQTKLGASHAFLSPASAASNAAR